MTWRPGLLLLALLAAGCTSAGPAPASAPGAAPTEGDAPPGDMMMDAKFGSAIARACESFTGYCFYSRTMTLDSELRANGRSDLYAWGVRADWDDTQVGLSQVGIEIVPAVEGGVPIFQAAGPRPIEGTIDAGKWEQGTSYALHVYAVQAGPALGLDLVVDLLRLDPTDPAAASP